MKPQRLIEVSIPSESLTIPAAFNEGSEIVFEIGEQVARVLAFTLIQYLLEGSECISAISAGDHRTVNIRAIEPNSKPGNQKRKKKGAAA